VTVVDLSRYRERRSVRRAAAYAVALWGAASLVLALWSARDRFDVAIRRAAELLPDDVDEAAS
jgi:hypothetical protein